MARNRTDLSAPPLADQDRRQRRIPDATVPHGVALSDDLVILATRLATVEQQLTSFFSSIAAQANASRLAAESARSDSRADLEALATSVRDAIERLTNQAIDDRKALRHALDARLADLGSHQDWRLAELEARIERMAEGGQALAALPAGTVPGPAASAHEIDHRIHSALGPIGSRVDSVGHDVGQISVRLAQLDASQAALQQIADGIQRTLEGQSTTSVDARLAELRDQISGSLTTLRAEVDAQTTATRNGVDGAFARLRADIDTAVIARVDALAGSVGTVNHTVASMAASFDGVVERVGDLDSGMSALRSGVDQTLAAVSARITEVEDGRAELTDRIVRMEQITTKVDPTEIDHLREKVQTAVGEAVLMRIEMDRLAGSLDERFDSVRVRLSEVEAQVADNMDVSTAVQLERLEELERAVLMLTPAGAPSAQFIALSQAERAAAPSVPVHVLGEDGLDADGAAFVPSAIAQALGTAAPGESPVPPPPVAAAPSPAPVAVVPPPPGAPVPAAPTIPVVPPAPAASTASIVPPPPPAASVPPPPTVTAVVPPPPPARSA